MNFTDTELMVLEQLTNLSAACDLADVSAPQVPGEQVKDRLAVFTDDVLMALEEKGNEGKQWAATIRYLKSNETICNLYQGEQFQDRCGRVLATAYYNAPPKSSDCVVTFHGTYTPDDWYDNGTGLGTSDTKSQKNALQYINSLPYDNVTVIGHSKGGNLAQYVTITSGKVDRCISVDGQGFSQEFLDKYWAEIQMNGGKIISYSLTTDFVHILLYPVPNSKQTFCIGEMVDSVVEHHFCNSFFRYETTDVDGKPVTKLKLLDGSPVIQEGEENETVAYLHRFTCFVLATMPQEERIAMGEFIGNILKIAATGTPVNGHTDAFSYVMSDQKMAGQLLAYLAQYIRCYDLSEEEVRGLLQMMGMYPLVAKVDQFYADHPAMFTVTYLGGRSLLMTFLKNLADGKPDPFIFMFLALIPGGAEIWTNAEKETMKMPIVPPNANQDGWSREGKEYHYTGEIYDALMSVYDQLTNMGAVNVSDWTDYADQKWYTKLFVGLFVSGINNYNEKAAQIVTAAKTKTDETFQNVVETDQNFGCRVKRESSQVGDLVLASR